MAHLLLFKALSWLFASSETDAKTNTSKTSVSPLKIGASVSAAALGYFLYKKYHKSASKKLKEPIRVVISGAAGQIGYSLVPLVCGGSVFGHDQPVILHLLDLPVAERALNGVKMEIVDCAYPLVKDVVCTSDLKVAFDKVNVAILVGGFPRKAGMQRADLMSKNAPIFVEQGAALNKYADRNVKVLVVANPANTNCLVLSKYAPDIPRRNFSCLTRLDQNRALGQLALKLGVDARDVGNAIIWGNHSKTQFPDVEHAYVQLPGSGERVSARAAINDEAWVRDVFTPCVQNRGAAVIEARGSSSALSAANATADHLRSWWQGTQPGEVVSMGVISEGDYGVAQDIVFSFPVTCKNGEWQVVQGLAPSNPQMIAVTQQELLDEKAEALNIAAQLAPQQ